VARSQRILYVDDDIAVASVVHRVCRRREDLCLLAETIAEGRELIAKVGESLDLAIIDLTLPDGCGLEFSKEIRRQWPNLRIVITTGNDDQVPPEFGMLRKPFSLDALMAVIGDRQGQSQSE
jgi:DNA-binding response OmpR family regulator